MPVIVAGRVFSPRNMTAERGRILRSSHAKRALDCALRKPAGLIHTRHARARAPAVTLTASEEISSTSNAGRAQSSFYAARAWGAPKFGSVIQAFSIIADRRMVAASSSARCSQFGIQVLAQRRHHGIEVS